MQQRFFRRMPRPTVWLAEALRRSTSTCSYEGMRLVYARYSIIVINRHQTPPQGRKQPCLEDSYSTVSFEHWFFDGPDSPWRILSFWKNDRDLHEQALMLAPNKNEEVTRPVKTQFTMPLIKRKSNSKSRAMDVPIFHSGEERSCSFNLATCPEYTPKRPSLCVDIMNHMNAVGTCGP